ncbi:hypothetical protein BTA07_07455 [Enterococcus faecium]|nr:hypothetical protein BTA07_07455 [Enterococcus faecium]
MTYKNIKSFKNAYISMFLPFFYISVICQKNVFNFNLYLNKEVAVLHQVIRTANQKQLLMFLIWLDLLPQI